MPATGCRAAQKRRYPFTGSVCFERFVYHGFARTSVLLQDAVLRKTKGPLQWFPVFFRTVFLLQLCQDILHLQGVVLKKSEDPHQRISVFGKVFRLHFRYHLLLPISCRAKALLRARATNVHSFVTTCELFHVFYEIRVSLFDCSCTFCAWLLLLVVPSFFFICSSCSFSRCWIWPGNNVIRIQCKSKAPFYCPPPHTCGFIIGAIQGHQIDPRYTLNFPACLQGGNSNNKKQVHPFYIPITCDRLYCEKASTHQEIFIETTRCWMVAAWLLLGHCMVVTWLLLGCKMSGKHRFRNFQQKSRNAIWLAPEHLFWK